MITIVLSLPIINFCGEGLRPNHIGDLGGVPVDMPKNLVHFVAYDGDPTFGNKREHPKPMRTYDSKINSFGFDLRYTDNTMLDTTNKALKSAYRRDNKRNLGDNPWVSVTVNSGDRVTVPNPVHRIGYGTLNPSKEAGPVHEYERLDNDQFGLEVYAPPNIDPVTNKPWRENRYAEDVFIQRDKTGQIITHIECSNRDVPRPPCTQFFNLGPQRNLSIKAHYSRYNLADWQQIEQVVRQHVLGFQKTS
ncbi:hypothetical protein IPZ60_04390 [Psychrobacter sp. NG25]|uniref:hypothetical protein n=1 Tax=Psychrobacter sp. NG25 TaxID=2782005 RepID=UPI001884301B|nr:hypothetical protein [Psychrobacter sp. NG25]MBF0657975.1 hypothetical protein [Psychrobacter sp. NG25]